MGFSYSDELWHFGIKGMKWGIRRYQNEDGTLTEEGRVHYGRKAERNGKHAEEYRKMIDTSDRVLRTRKAISDILAMPNKTPEQRKQKIKAQEEFLNKMKLGDDTYLLKEHENKWTTDMLKKEYGKNFKEILSDESAIEEGAEIYNQLFSKVRIESGDWYNGQGVSNDFKKNREFSKQINNKMDENYEKMRAIRKEGKKDTLADKNYQRLFSENNDYKEQINKLDDDLLGIALKDIGFEDTKKSRNLMRNVVIWD